MFSTKHNKRGIKKINSEINKMNKLYFRKERYLVSEFPSQAYRPAHNDTAEFVGLTAAPENLHYEVIDKIYNYFQNQENTTSEDGCSKM